MFGIGVPELMIILVIGLVVFGPGKLPEIGRALGKTINEFKKMSASISLDTPPPAPAPRPAQTAPTDTPKPAVTEVKAEVKETVKEAEKAV